MDGAFFWTVAVLAAVIVGMGKGGLPLVGMLGVPILSQAVHPVTAAGLLLPVYVASDMFGLYAYRGEFDKRVPARSAAMSLKEKPLPPRESCTSLYKPTASASGLPEVADSAAEMVKC